MDTKKSLSYQHIVFALIAIVVFYKCMLFHNLCFESTPEKLNFGFYLPKIAVALCIASFAYLFKRQWWSIAVLLLIDTWCFANLTYFRANNLLLTLDVIRIADNLEGFGSSVLQYVDWSSWSFLISTIIYCLTLFLAKKICNNGTFISSAIIKHQYIAFALGLLCATACSLTGSVLSFNSRHAEDDSRFDIENLNPFLIASDMKEEQWIDSKTQLDYVNNRSIIIYAVNMLYEGYMLDRRRQQKVEISEDEMLLLQRVTKHDSGEHIIPERNLVIVFVESFESWTLEVRDVAGQPATPNILSLMQRRASLYCNKVKSQVLYGTSGDGQMILNSGLLPLQNGVACLRYGVNTYPGFAHLYAQSTLINPAGNVWNQTIMTNRYGYEKQISPSELNIDNITVNWWNDSTIFHKSVEHFGGYEMNERFCTFIITLSSHSPFWMYDRSFDMDLTKNWSETARKYIGSIHYMDHYLGQLIDYMESQNMFDNTVLVITGDHTIFKESTLDQITDGAKSDNLSVANGKNYLPLIVVGDGISDSKVVSDIVYQMDIYPTILKLIGADNYYWQGLGIDLMSDETQCRQISEHEAYVLSDKLIRSNYFGNR